MRKRHWLTVGTALLLASCQSNRAAQKVQPAPQAFAQPVLPSKPTLQPAMTVPGIIPTSDKVPLMPVAVSSTRDPFAATTIPTDLKATIQPAASKTIAVKSSISAPPVISLPQPVIAPIPQPAPPTAPTLPTLSPPLPPVSRTNLADTIALTGVIQTGNKLSAIVQDSDGSSRYIQVGESLANGQVTVKKINLNAAGDPSIVLSQNGVELIKTVGRSESSIAQTF